MSGQLFERSAPSGAGRPAVRRRDNSITSVGQRTVDRLDPDEGRGGAVEAASPDPFPTRAREHESMCAAVFQWADRRGIVLDRPRSRTDAYRALLAVTFDHLGPDDPAYRRVVSRVCAEYVCDVMDVERGTDDGRVVHGGLFRLVGLYPALAVLAALEVAMSKPTLFDPAAVLAYAAAILRGGGRR